MSLLYRYPAGSTYVADAARSYVGCDRRHVVLVASHIEPRRYLVDLGNQSPVAAPPIRATAFVGRWPNVPAGDWPEIPTGTFSPTSATLVSGPTEAVLIDALYLKDDVRELGDLIERTGKRLTTIYITHAHADHYAGFGPLLERFPDAVCVAMPHVIDAMKEGMDLHTQQWAMLFGDACVTPGPLPDPIEGRTLFVDGSPVNIIEVKQADIHPTSIVHVPEIDVVIAGDSIYTRSTRCSASPRRRNGRTGSRPWTSWRA